MPQLSYDAIESGLLTDQEIMTAVAEKGMISPFSQRSVDPSKISYGISSMGYDVRLGREFKIFTNVSSTIIDPKRRFLGEKNPPFVTHEGDYCIIPPNSFVLAHSYEHFKLPDDIMSICVGKSTYARCGLIVNVTPLEPGWEGQVTLEISNTTPLPAKVYAEEGIAQFLFFKTRTPSINYRTKGGKYQNQKGITLPKLCADNIEKATEELAKLSREIQETAEGELVSFNPVFLYRLLSLEEIFCYLFKMSTDEVRKNMHEHCEFGTIDIQANGLYSFDTYSRVKAKLESPGAAFSVSLGDKKIQVLVSREMRFA